MNFKKLLSIILVCCMLMAVLSFTACGNKDNDKDNDGDKTNEGNVDTNNNQTNNKTYTVTVLDSDNNPIEGMRVIITDGKNVFKTATTGANGKASTEIPEPSDGNISVMLTSMPGYVMPEKISGSYHGVFANNATELTIVLEKETSDTVTYYVRVVDQYGDPVVGMQVQLCPNGVCLVDQFITDANGEISKELAPGKNIDVKLYDLEGYTLPIANGYGYHEFIAAGQTEVTITVTKN